METGPPEKRLEAAPFAVQATRGILRDPKTRRKTMVILLGVALLMMVAGFFGLRQWLEPREHPARFILFWAVCGWITFTTLLLALLDLLLVRAAVRQARKTLQKQVDGSSGVDRPD